VIWRRRKRFERVASFELPPSQWERAWKGLRRRDVLGRIGLAALASLAICAVIRGWNPPFAYRTGYTPPRDIAAAVRVTKVDLVATESAREQARAQARYVYAQDAEPLVQLRAELRNKLMELTAAASLDQADPALWNDFQIDADKLPTAKPPEERFREFREAFAPQERLDRVVEALEEAFAPFENNGLLDKLDQDKLGPGNKDEILVYPLHRPEERRAVPVRDVLIGDGTAIRDNMRRFFDLSTVTDRLFAWLFKRLKPTLSVDERLTKESRNQAAADVADVLIEYSKGQTLAKANFPLETEQLDLLQREYDAAVAERPLGKRLGRAAAVTALILAALLLCGVHMRYRQSGPLANIVPLIVLLLMAVAVIAVARWASIDAWRAELVPVLLFGAIMAIVYQRELSLLLSGTAALIVAMAVGREWFEFFLLTGTTATAVLCLGSIRSRSRLIYVGLFAAAAAVLLHVVLGLIDDQPFNRSLIAGAIRNGFWAVTVGFITLGLLPFIETVFGVLTDLSLLELGDVAHPLLQELVRRAPSTYNHSVTVGSIAEAAAESIGARGLLVRVGAYFHDIGKMLKPGYFIENQGPDDNRHDALVPAMSTLVIVSHIKDGADLARQHRLPQPIVDLIAQHHGTTRVEFFYDRATEQQQQTDPDGAEVDESTFRYPGPKPQTKEAAVLMLADAVESASRTLVDPTPARIESLVRDIAEQRLRGGQFDDSGLSLRELRTIEKSMIVSLTSIYHGRIKYPEPRTA